MTNFEAPATPDLSIEQEAALLAEETDPGRLQRVRQAAADIIKIMITTDPREVLRNYHPN